MTFPETFAYYLLVTSDGKTAEIPRAFEGLYHCQLYAQGIEDRRLRDVARRNWQGRVDTKDVVEKARKNFFIDHAKFPNLRWINVSQDKYVAERIGVKYVIVLFKSDGQHYVTAKTFEPMIP